jgi:hypothetical protein
MSSSDVRPTLPAANTRPPAEPDSDAQDEQEVVPAHTTDSPAWWRRNGLVLVCTGLFLVFLGAQSATGWRVYNSANEEHGQETVTYGSYLTSGHFVEGTLENWESEFLQMAAFVLLTVFFVQKGSAESKEAAHVPSDEEILGHRDEPGAPWPVRRGGLWLKGYENSLFLAFLVLFLLSIAGHALGGVHEFNEEQVSHGQPEVSVTEFAAASDFWFQSFQNWQSEFLAVAAISTLSIFLRQTGSSQSKPVYAPNEKTGDQ